MNKKNYITLKHHSKKTSCFGILNINFNKLKLGSKLVENVIQNNNTL